MGLGSIVRGAWNSFRQSNVKEIMPQNYIEVRLPAQKNYNPELDELLIAAEKAYAKYEGDYSRTSYLENYINLQAHRFNVDIEVARNALDIPLNDELLHRLDEYASMSTASFSAKGRQLRRFQRKLGEAFQRYSGTMSAETYASNYINLQSKNYDLLSREELREVIIDGKSPRNDRNSTWIGPLLALGVTSALILGIASMKPQGNFNSALYNNLYEKESIAVVEEKNAGSGIGSLISGLADKASHYYNQTLGQLLDTKVYVENMQEEADELRDQIASTYTATNTNPEAQDGRRNRNPSTTQPPSDPTRIYPEDLADVDDISWYGNENWSLIVKPAADGSGLIASVNEHLDRFLENREGGYIFVRYDDKSRIIPREAPGTYIPDSHRVLEVAAGSIYSTRDQQFLDLEITAPDDVESIFVSYQSVAMPTYDK